MTLVATCCVAAEEELRPNILLVLSDDQDNEHLGFRGNEVAHTPTIDRLARAGTLFPVMHTPSRCRPSLAVLLSGRYGHQSGVYYNRGPRQLETKDSLPNRLKDAGYRTFCGGKFWEGDPVAMGFDAAPYEPEEFVREGQRELFAWLEEDSEQPFFVWWAPAMPHLPHDAPQEILDRIDRDRIEVPAWFNVDPDIYRDFERDLLAMGSWMDDGLAQLLDKLEELGQLENTLICFLIDNGYSNGLISKGSNFEKGISTPAFLAWPGRVPVQTVDALTSSVDVYRTLLDYAAVPREEADRLRPGRSLRPLVEGKTYEPRTHLFGTASSRTASAAGDAAQDIYSIYCRDERWKYVLYLEDVPKEMWEITRATPIGRHERRRGEQDLYDLSTDPYELDNLAADPAHAERIESLRAAALEWWEATGGGALDLP